VRDSDAPRLSAVRSLIEFSRPLIEIKADLTQWPWDYDGEPAVLRRSHVESVLRRCLSGDLPLAELEAWADTVECREDIDFEPGSEQWIAAVVFTAANPETYGKLTAEEIAVLLKS